MQHRIAFIDVAKGISILLVAFFHSHLGKFFPEVNETLGLIRMPFFFFLAGVFLREDRKPLAFALHKTDALLKPYIVTVGFLGLVWIARGDMIPSREWIGLLTGKVESDGWQQLWFLPHLWLVFLFSYLLVTQANLASARWPFKVLVVVSLLAAGVLIIEQFWPMSMEFLGTRIEIRGLPLCMDILLISSAFFLAGRFLSDQVQSFKPNGKLLLVSVVLFFLITSLSDPSLNLNGRKYTRPVATTAAAFLGIYIMLSVSYLLSRHRVIARALLTIGSASLFILLFHHYIERKIHAVLSTANVWGMDIIAPVLAFLLGIIMPLLLRKIIHSNDFLRCFYFPLRHNAFIHRLYRIYRKQTL